MKLWNASAILLVFCVGAVAQTATDLESQPVLRVADKLKCSCGCTLTMACKMEGDCQICRRGKAQVFAMQQAGKSDDEILAQFVKDSGPDVIVKRPGIMGVGGVAIAAAIGFGLVLLVIRRSRQKAAVAAPDVDPAVLDKIDQDLTRLD
jgi:cytochrome c-type biogenesis protein CcmH/NrfF